MRKTVWKSQLNWHFRGLLVIELWQKHFHVVFQKCATFPVNYCFGNLRHSKRRQQYSSTHRFDTGLQVFMANISECTKIAKWLCCDASVL